MSEIAVLVSARRNSKYLAKFLFGLYDRTASMNRIEAHIMLNEHDTWNEELVTYFEGRFDSYNRILFYKENMQLGRAGLHRYFNELIKNTKSDWIVYFCEDHFIDMGDWDTYVLSYINGDRKSADSNDKTFPLDPNEPWVLVPKFDNCGAMNHIVSRGFVKAMGDQIGRHGWIDSYINELMSAFPERVIRMDDEMLHDFTHDVPSPMSDAHSQSISSKKGEALPKFEDPTVRKLIKEDQERLRKAIEKGAR